MRSFYINDIESTYKHNKPFTTLVHLFRRDRVNLLLAALFFVVKHSPVWMFPVVTAGVINSITGQDGKSIEDLWKYLIFMSIMVAQNIPTHVLFTKFFSTSLRNMEARLRSALVRRLQQLSIAFHDEFKSGRLHSKVLRDVESVEMLGKHAINAVLPGILTILVALGVALYREPLVALFFIVAVPAATTLIRVFRTRMRQRNAEFRSEIEMMSARVSEMIEMIPVTRAHGAENVEITKMDSQLEQVRNSGIRLDVLSSVFQASAWVAFQTFNLLALLVTGYMAYIGRIPVGDVVMYQTFYTMIVGSVTALLNVYPMLNRGFESIRSMGEILECPDIELNIGKKRVHDVKGDLRFENVSLTYDDGAEAAVQGFTLDVGPGETVALVGPSGAGKTSVVNLIIGFRRPTEGAIFLDGVDMNTLDLRGYRQHLSVVSQNTVLFSGSVRNNITYGLHDVDDERLYEALRLANAAEFVDRLPGKLDTMIGEHGAKLSGGQRQRIAIARALIRDPRVILFDEATSALDVFSEALVQEAIERLIEGRTTFIVAHRLSTIRKANRIVVMKEGRIVEQGDHQQLLKLRGEFYRMHAMQV
jgi:ATP-binding cassette subfamily B protein